MGTNRDIRIPADSIHAMRRSLQSELGAEPAGRALQEAGYAAGDVLFERLTRTMSESDIAGTASTSFWERLASMCRELGWGSLRHEQPHPGVGALVATEWFEVDPDRSRALCPFTTGLLANVLGRVAGQDVAVLQVDCAGEDPACARFLFGAAGVLDTLYAGLREGRDVETSLSALG